MTEEELKQEAENNKPPYAFCALNTNCELWKDGYEKGAEPREKRIAELEKENAELKEQKEMLEKGYVWHDYDAGEDCYEDTHEGKWVKRDEVYQLAKAKELLKQFLEAKNSEDTYKAEWEAEQFLSEVEK